MNRLATPVPRVVLSCAAPGLKTLFNRTFQFAFTLLCFHFGMAGQSIVVDSEITIFRYRLGSDLQNGVNPQQTTFTARCTIETNRWCIEVPEEALMLKWFYDGTNLISSASGPVSIARRLQAPVSRLQSNATARPVPSPVTGSSAHVWESVDPCPFDNPKVTIPWLAFCSGSYLKRPGRLVPNPIVHLQHSPDAFAFEDKTSIFPDPLGLPKDIELYASDEKFARSVTDSTFEGTHDVELWKRGAAGFKWDLKNGFLRFRYAVTESTNCSGWNVPLRFAWHLGVPESGKLVQVAAGRITSLKTADRFETPLETNWVTTIADWRFQDRATGVRAIMYHSDKASVLPANDPSLQAKFLGKKRRAADRARSTRTAYLGRIVLLLAVVLSPVVFSMLYRARRN